MLRRLAIVLALALTGCPRQVTAPEPMGTTPCRQLTDCNPGASCGALRLCVEGFCEAEPSLVRPCPHEGQPVPDDG